jgi:catechol 2,3-dioxygenase-like lactoylglutathione lyase family enzyme
MVEPARLELCVPTLRVTDADASARYFCEKLGFTRDWEHRFEPGLPLYVSVSRDAITLHLSEHTGDGPLEVRVYAYVSDATNLHAELVRRGARVVAAPEVTSYGVTEFHVEDLDGNRIRFGQRSADR